MRKTFSGEKNGLKIGQMSFTAQKDAEEERTISVKVINFHTLKKY